jgi:hypothetical protein
MPSSYSSNQDQRDPNVPKGRPLKVITSSTAVTPRDSGAVIICNAADLVVSLPLTQEGLWYTIVTAVTSGGTGTSVSPYSADKIAGLGIVSPTDDKDFINSGASDAGGDFLTVIGDGGDGWWIADSRGTWARES